MQILHAEFNPGNHYGEEFWILTLKADTDIDWYRNKSF